MLRSEILNTFLKKGVLSNKKGNKIVRPFCWKRRFDSNCQEIWSEFIKSYRSEDEAWFCLVYNIDPPICCVCHKNICKFCGQTCGGKRRYNTVCEYCSANKSIEKNCKFKETISKRSKDAINCIIQKRQKTNLERYNTQNYMCFGSKDFQNLMLKKYGDKFITFIS